MSRLFKLVWWQRGAEDKQQAATDPHEHTERLLPGDRLLQYDGGQQQDEDRHGGGDDGGVDWRRTVQPDDEQSLIDPHSAKGAYKKHPQVFQRHFLFYREERHDPEHHTGESHAHDRKTFGGNVCRQQIFGYRHVDGKQDIGYQYQDVTFQFLAVHDKCSYL